MTILAEIDSGKRVKSDITIEPIDPALVHRLQVTAAIDAVEEYCNRLTDLGCENYLQIHHELIEELSGGQHGD
jgi:hypothetical protein